MCDKLKNINSNIDLEYLLIYIEGNCMCNFCINNNNKYKALKIIVKFLKSKIAQKKNKIW